MSRKKTYVTDYDKLQHLMLCSILDCQISDIIRYEKNDKK